MRSARMRVSVLMGMLVTGLHQDDVQRSMTHASLRLDMVGESPDAGDRTLEHHGLKTVIVVKVYMGRRKHQFMVLVLHFSEHRRQVSLAMSVDVGEVCDAVPLLDLASAGA